MLETSTTLFFKGFGINFRHCTALSAFPQGWNSPFLEDSAAPLVLPVVFLSLNPALLASSLRPGLHNTAPLVLQRRKSLIIIPPLLLFPSLIFLLLSSFSYLPSRPSRPSLPSRSSSLSPLPRPSFTIYATQLKKSLGIAFHKLID
ncbi:MAG: hypothetical protein ACI9S8_000976 [Chlamydiales bacterium]